MRVIMMLIGIMLPLIGCSRDAQETIPLTVEPIVITDPGELDTHVGKLVTIRGIVSNTKSATILGVDVGTVGSGAPRELLAEATGVLVKWIETPEEHAEMEAHYGIFQTRGPGTYYRIVDPTTGEIVDAVAVPNPTDQH